MKIRINLLYVLLVGVLFVDTTLFGIYLYLNKQKGTKRLSESPKRQRVVLQKPDIVFENRFKELDVGLNKNKMFNLFQNVKFLRNYLAVNLTTLQEYNPKKIVIAFYEEENFQGLPLSQRFKVNKIMAYGYEVVQDEKQYRINFYFNPKYLATLKGEELNYVLNSALIKAVVRLAALHEKKRRLTEQEEDTMLRKAVEYLEEFRPIYVKNH